MSDSKTEDPKVCWCGDAHEPQCPRCDKCGAPVETGFMAFICPFGDSCEFMPDNEESRQFVRSHRMSEPVADAWQKWAEAIMEQIGDG